MNTLQEVDLPGIYYFVNDKFICDIGTVKVELA